MIRSIEKLAPIGISTYSRLNHLQQTIDALRKNTLAKQSELYIFSDAPRVGDEEIVANVRAYINTLSDGFKKIHIIERIENGRMANNRGGIKQLLDKFGKIIFLEEDIVTAPGFLQYMNNALEVYKDDEDILSITGYTPPIVIPASYKQTCFVLQRFSAWGFATWKHKFNPFGFDVHQHGVKEFLENKKEIKKFMENGEDMYKMLLLEDENKIDALDVKIMYYQYRYNKYTLYPVDSLVQNIGHDGSGIHCGNSDKFHHDKLWKKENDFKFLNDIQVNEKIKKANYNFRRNPKIGIREKVVDLIKKVGLYSILKTFKDRVV